MRGGVLAGALMVGVLAALVLGMAGCARKAAHSPLEPASTPPTMAEPESLSPPVGPTETSEELLPVFYAFDSHALSETARTALDRNAATLRKHANLQITVEGHCDERGTAEYNQALGERRAQAARDYLVAAGVARERIAVISYGKERPFEPGHTEAAWARNRRAHISSP